MLKTQKNALLAQMIAQQKRLIDAAKTDEAAAVHMTETRIYVGLNDAETREQKHDTERYLSVLKHVCRSYRVAFSLDIEQGGYFHEDGEYTEERSLVLVLINADKGIVREIAKDLCTFFHQESVLVTENRVEGYFVERAIIE